MNNTELIQTLSSEFRLLFYKDENNLNALQSKARMIIRNIFGNSSHYLEEFNSISFAPSFYPSSEEYQGIIWNRGINQSINLFKTMIEEIKIFRQSNSNTKTVTELSNKIFIVHGHDNEMKQSVARMLQKLELEPVILHEQPNKGMTIIEKFVDYSDVSFAIVLLSPDDLAYPRNGSPDNAKSRARQNVILELGFFIGRLGRENVVTLYRQENDFEIPSDFSGVLYTSYDPFGYWQLSLSKELKVCGYNIDVNKL